MGQTVRDIQGLRLQAAQTLLRITSEGSRKIENEADFIWNLQERQDVIEEIDALQERLSEIKRSGAQSGAFPGEDETAAQADRVLMCVRELYRQNIDEVNRRLQQYRRNIAQVKTEKKGLAAYLTSGADTGCPRFDGRG